MIVDHKSRDVSSSEKTNPLPPSHAVASTSGRKLSIEMPSSRQIYTVGSTVSGIVHLGTKDRESIQEVQVSLVCTVRSIHHRYLGGNAHDIRHETIKLIHRDQTLWSSQGEEASNPPADIAFQITIPEVGNDSKAKNPDTPLPPSFHAGKQRGWENMFTHGISIGSIKYHIKAAVVRRGTFKLKERVFYPFLFLPPSPPPPLLPTPPEIISEDELDNLNDMWESDNASTNLHKALFSSNGRASLTLWLPCVASFPRLTRIPFVLRLALQTRTVKDASEAQPPKGILPPVAQLDKASMHLRRHVRCCAKGGVQNHFKTFDSAPTDDLLHGITPQESEWTLKKDGLTAYWEKGYIWRGLWTFKETPNFVNRQLTWEYSLVAEAPIKGIGNEVKLVSRALQINSGITAGTNIVTTSDEEMLELPPDYFDIEGINEKENDDDKSEDRDEKS